MSEKTCAACDYPLDDSAIQVRVGGRTVEVCCEDCAVKLKEAHASATALPEGRRLERACGLGGSGVSAGLEPQREHAISRIAG